MHAVHTEPCRSTCNNIMSNTTSFTPLPSGLLVFKCHHGKSFTPHLWCPAGHPSPLSTVGRHWCRCLPPMLLSPIRLSTACMYHNATDSRHHSDVDCKQNELCGLVSTMRPSHVTVSRTCVSTHRMPGT